MGDKIILLIIIKNGEKIVLSLKQLVDETLSFNKLLTEIKEIVLKKFADYEIKRHCYYDKELDHELDILENSVFLLEDKQKLIFYINETLATTSCAANTVTNCSISTLTNSISNCSIVSEIDTSIQEKVTKLVEKADLPQPPRHTPDFTLWRQHIIRVVGTHLVNSSKAPPLKEEKRKYAKAMISAFPDLGINGKYNHIYDCKTNKGFLEHNIRNKRSRSKSIDIQKREYSKRIQEDVVSFDTASNEVENIINWLNNTVNNEHSREQILLKMKSITEYRINWILAEMPTITEILSKFKRYLDCEILFSIDFEFKFGSQKADLLLSKWDMVIPRIISYSNLSKNASVKNLVKSNNQTMLSNEKSFLAFKMLCAILPSQNRKSSTGGRVNCHEVQNFIFRSFKPGTPISECLASLTDVTQPLLIILEECFEIKQIFIKLDGQAIEIKNNINYIYAVDILFKIYWVFNLEYPIQAVNIMYFLECIYELGITPKKPSVDSLLHSFLNKEPDLE